MPAWRSAAAWCTLLAVFTAGLIADLWTKSWAFATVAGMPVVLEPREAVADPSYRLPWHSGVRALPWDLLDFHLVVNHGAVFGIGQNARGWFIAFTVIAVAAGIVIFGWWTRASSRLAHIGLGLILAGGIGNLYDRFVFGAVRDFLHMLPRWNLPFGLSWPGGNREVFPWVFNIADVMLLAGMALLIIHAHREDARRAREAKIVAGAGVAAPASDAPAPEGPASP
ncbi:MAG: signal peptidase II [Phycisphaerales bacterium]|nr:signal peptidase II [Phycisphaerales bacterium]